MNVFLCAIFFTLASACVRVEFQGDGAFALCCTNGTMLFNHGSITSFDPARAPFCPKEKTDADGEEEGETSTEQSGSEGLYLHPAAIGIVVIVIIGILL